MVSAGTKEFTRGASRNWGCGHARTQKIAAFEMGKESIIGWVFLEPFRWHRRVYYGGRLYGPQGAWAAGDTSSPAATDRPQKSADSRFATAFGYHRTANRRKNATGAVTINEIRRMATTGDADASADKMMKIEMAAKTAAVSQERPAPICSPTR